MASLQSSLCMLLTTNHKTLKTSSASARRFHVSCGVDRRDMLLGLGSLKALADPDIKSCGMPPDENCCPPSSDAIKDYERILGDLINDLTFALPFSIFNDPRYPLYETSCNSINRGFSKTEDFMGQFYMVGNPPPPGEGGGRFPDNEEKPIKLISAIRDEYGKAVVVTTLIVFPDRLKNFLIDRLKNFLIDRWKFIGLRIKREN